MGKHSSSLCYVKALKDDSEFSGKKAIKNMVRCSVQKRSTCVKLCNNCTKKRTTVFSHFKEKFYAMIGRFCFRPLSVNYSFTQNHYFQVKHEKLSRTIILRHYFFQIYNILSCKYTLHRRIKFQSIMLKLKDVYLSDQVCIIFGKQLKFSTIRNLPRTYKQALKDEPNRN